MTGMNSMDLTASLTGRIWFFCFLLLRNDFSAHQLDEGRPSESEYPPLCVLASLLVGEPASGEGVSSGYEPPGATRLRIFVLRVSRECSRRTPEGRADGGAGSARTFRVPEAPLPLRNLSTSGAAVQRPKIICVSPFAARVPRCTSRSHGAGHSHNPLTCNRSLPVVREASRERLRRAGGVSPVRGNTRAPLVSGNRLRAKGSVECHPLR